MHDLSGKLALITGAGQGIGAAIAQAFLQQGAHVLACDIAADKLLQYAGHPNVQACVLDATDRNAIAALGAAHGPLDVLVNCAGYVASGTVLDATDDEIERTFAINFRAALYTIQQFLPSMVERGRGSIINIASVVSHTKAAPNRCLYAASKSALLAMTKAVALDYVKTGVRANTISPGTVASPSLAERMAASSDAAAALQAFTARQPMGRLGQADEIAALASLLASDAAQFMTGADLIIDGGFSL